MSTKLAQLEVLVEKLEDAMQPSVLDIKQDARGRWPKFNPEWRAKMIVVAQGRDGSWPPYGDKLGQHCDLIAERRTFSTPPPRNLSTPPHPPANTAAYLERKAAIAMGQQVPLDPERLDRS